ncbi:MAG: CRTAC1 family protein [Planctomycetes bacterium]|nr:CRTAC1 family protein [Planctomycetota bacterium]
MKSARGFLFGRARACLAVGTLVLGADASAGGVDWISFADETATRLVADPSVGVSDPFEKDIAVGDVDNDGDPDLLFVNSRRWKWDRTGDEKPATMALYENDGTGRFKEVTAGSGLDVSLYGMGVAIGDFDNDGRVDVYVTAVGPNRLFRNLGKGKFADVTKAAGVAGGEKDWGTSAGFFDYDNDGDLDLFVCNYVKWSRAFDAGQKSTLDGTLRAYGDPKKFPGSFCSLFRNEGRGRFADVSRQAGIQVENRKNKPAGKSLGVCFADLDRDGDLDVVVANDTVPNFLFENLGNGKFKEHGRTANLALGPNAKARGAMGIDVAHFRNNRELGIAIGNFSTEMTALYVSSNGELLFTDQAVSNGIGPVTRQVLTFGVLFFDADLDGRLDLFAANGHLEKDIAKVQARQTYQQPPQLLWNCGPQYKTEFLSIVKPVKPLRKKGETDAAFQNRTEKWKAESKDFASRMEDFTRAMVGRGTAFADIDRDGDLDLVIVGNGQPPRLLRNDQQLGHNWLQFKIVGRRSNRDAIGARVEVHLPDGTVLRQQVMPTRGYLSQVELPVCFGLGKIDRVSKVRVIWPSGAELDVTSKVRLNSRLTVTEPARK